MFANYFKYTKGRNEIMKLLKCGHEPNATSNGKPCCAICNCFEFAENEPDLTGRWARCSDCGRIEPSRLNLFFFVYKPNCKYDSFYCGCKGWD